MLQIQDGLQAKFQLGFKRQKAPNKSGHLPIRTRRGKQKIFAAKRLDGNTPVHQLFVNRVVKVHNYVKTVRIQRHHMVRFVSLGIKIHAKNNVRRMGVKGIVAVIVLVVTIMHHLQKLR